VWDERDFVAFPVDPEYPVAVFLTQVLDVTAPDRAR
jgi:hypothetical protein